jgi:methionine--tRNA ligase beta chain
MSDAVEAAVPEWPLTELSRVEMRVGKILEVSKHPEADSLYVEKVDCGEESGPRTIVSGLVKYCTAEHLLNREVVVLMNLKPRALKGITSNGMLLCASSADHSQVDPLAPPRGCAVGDQITFQGHQVAPMAAGNRASKAFSKIAADLFVDAEGRATYQGVPFMTAHGAVTASIVNGSIS